MAASRQLREGPSECSISWWVPWDASILAAAGTSKVWRHLLSSLAVRHEIKRMVKKVYRGSSDMPYMHFWAQSSQLLYHDTLAHAYIHISSSFVREQSSKFSKHLAIFSPSGARLCVCCSAHQEFPHSESYYPSPMRRHAAARLGSVFPPFGWPGQLGVRSNGQSFPWQPSLRNWQPADSSCSITEVGSPSAEQLWHRTEGGVEIRFHSTTHRWPSLLQVILELLIFGVSACRWWIPKQGALYIGADMYQYIIMCGDYTNEHVDQFV